MCPVTRNRKKLCPEKRDFVRFSGRFFVDLSGECSESVPCSEPVAAAQLPSQNVADFDGGCCFLKLSNYLRVGHQASDLAQ